jgi:hypothetical protein
MRTEKQRQMKRLRKRKHPLPSTLPKASIRPASPQEEPDDLASLEERAEARQLLTDRNQPPHFDVHFVDPQPDEQYSMVEGSHVCDSWTATAQGGNLPNKDYTRLPSESFEQFEVRCRADDLVGGPPRLIIFWPVKDPEANP